MKTLRERLEALGFHLSICHNYNDIERMEACTTDDELRTVYENINNSIHKVSVANQAINHSNFYYDEKVLGKLGE